MLLTSIVAIIKKKFQSTFAVGGDPYGPMEQQCFAIRPLCHRQQGHAASRRVSTWHLPAHEAQPPRWSIMYVGNMSKQKQPLPFCFAWNVFVCSLATHTRMHFCSECLLSCPVFSSHIAPGRAIMCSGRQVKRCRGRWRR